MIYIVDEILPSDVPEILDTSGLHFWKSATNPPSKEFSFCACNGMGVLCEHVFRNHHEIKKNKFVD